MAQVLSIISIISFVLAGICFVLAVFFWFKFGIPGVIGDLSGRTARKSIAKMREQNEKSGNKSYRSSAVNMERVKVTETIPQDSEETELLAENKDRTYEEQETELLTDTETTLLVPEENETAPLDVVAEQLVVRPSGKKLKILDEVILVHTEEEIK